MALCDFRSRYYMYDRVVEGRKGHLVEEGSIFEKYKGLRSDITKVDAAFVWLRNGRTYIFTGDDYYRYDERRERVDYQYPKKISSAWRGFPNDVDSVFVWKNDVTYFFKGEEYVAIL